MAGISVTDVLDAVGTLLREQGGVACRELES
jgi:hypothetical protein